MNAVCDGLDRAVGAAIGLGRWLVIPVSLLLFLQWPLRDLAHAYSIEVNDLAQWLFALYVGLAVTDATRAGTHLAADVLARRYPAAVRRRLRGIAALVSLIPWSLFVLVSGAPTVWRSIEQFEGFPDTSDPFYFVIRVSAWILALLVLLQALIDLARPKEAA